MCKDKPFVQRRVAAQADGAWLLSEWRCNLGGGEGFADLCYSNLAELPIQNDKCWSSYICMMYVYNCNLKHLLKASWHELATIEERDGSGIKPDAVVGQARIRTGFYFLPLCGFQNPDLSSI